MKPLKNGKIEDGDDEVEIEAVKAIVFDGLDTWLDTTKHDCSFESH